MPDDRSPPQTPGQLGSRDQPARGLHLRRGRHPDNACPDGRDFHECLGVAVLNRRDAEFHSCLESDSSRSYRGRRQLLHHRGAAVRGPLAVHREGSSSRNGALHGQGHAGWQRGALPAAEVRRQALRRRSASGVDAGVRDLRERRRRDGQRDRLSGPAGSDTRR